MKYSFVVPTYNSEDWIQSSIGSLLAQSLPDYNIIILDSGSTDNTLPWLRSLQSDRLIIHTTPHRLSIEDNWARIRQVPRHTFMTIMSHDDLMYPTYLETMDQLISANPDAALYQAHFDCIDGQGKLIRPCQPMPASMGPARLLEAILTHTMDITATGFMVRGADYDAVGGIPGYPKLLFADTELWLQLILQSRLAISPVNCFAFRFHQNNTSKSPGMERLVSFEKMISFLHQLQQGNEAYAGIIGRHAYAFLQNYTVGTYHKLLYVDPGEKGGVNREAIVASANQCAAILIPAGSFEAANLPGMRFAEWIDQIDIFRQLFVWVKSFQKRAF